MWHKSVHNNIAKCHEDKEREKERKNSAKTAYRAAIFCFADGIFEASLLLPAASSTDDVVVEASEINGLVVTLCSTVVISDGVGTVDEHLLADDIADTGEGGQLAGACVISEVEVLLVDERNKK